MPARVNEFHATPSSLGRSRETCGTAMQNNKIQKAKFFCVCSANLELTNDDRSRLFCFNEQFEWTFESWTVSQSLYGTDLAPMWQLSVNSLREHKYPYLLILTKSSGQAGYIAVTYWAYSVKYLCSIVQWSLYGYTVCTNHTRYYFFI